MFHSICQIWVSWYLLVMCVSLPLFSATVSFIPMLRAKPSVDMNERLTQRAAEYIRCCCDGGGRIFRYPPQCVLLVRVSYLAADHSSDYEAELTSGEPMFIRVNTRHCTTVRVECKKAYVLDYLGVFRLPMKRPPVLDGVIMPIPAQDETRIEKTVSSSSERPESTSALRSRELYELREYREGDTLRDIHWKMTAKTGRTIVREGERVEDCSTAVILDLMEDLSANDGVMGLAYGVSRGLLDAGQAHSLIWIDEKEELRTFDIRDRAQQLAAFTLMLGDRPPASGRSVTEAVPEGYDVILHILPGEAEQEYE